MEVPSLQSLSIVAFSVSTFRKMKKHLKDKDPELDSQEKLKKLEDEIQYGDNMDEMRAILIAIFETMVMPRRLKVETTTIVRRIFEETVEWLKRNFVACPEACSAFPRVPEDGTDVFDFLTFKADGTIDQFLTADKFVKNDGNSNLRRFLMASNHCFRDKIYSLWPNLNEDERENVNKMGRNDPLLWHWFQCLTKPNYDSSLNSRNKFRCLAIWAYSNNLTALNYIYENIEPENQTRCLNLLDNVSQTFGINSAIREFGPFKRNLNDFRSRIIKRKIQFITDYYLKWPNQENFLEEAVGILDRLTSSEYNSLLQNIVCNKINCEWDDYDYKELVYKLFLRCAEPAEKRMLEKENFNQDDVMDYLNKEIDQMIKSLLKSKSTLESTIDICKKVFYQLFELGFFVLYVVVVIYSF